MEQELRTAFQAPLPCYGSEYVKADPICQECPHNEGCIKATGSRISKITLDRVKFKFMPEKFAPEEFTDGDPDLIDVESLYEVSYQTVFGTKPMGGFRKYPKARQILTRSAKAADCSVKLFMLTVMMAWKRTNPDRDFYPNMLLGEAAILKVGKYRNVCAKRYGTFDLTAMDTLMESNTGDLDKKMLQSEVAAGIYIVGFKIWKGGKPFENMYLEVERKLDPYWCAIEPTYFEYVLKKHLQAPYGSLEQNRFRHSVCQTMAYLKKGKRRVIPMFESRERIMAEAVKRVCGHFSYHEKDFEAENKPVTNSLVFWSRLGLAIQHFRCLKYLDGEEDQLTYGTSAV